MNKAASSSSASAPAAAASVPVPAPDTAWSLAASNLKRNSGTKKMCQLNIDCTGKVGSRLKLMSPSIAFYLNALDIDDSAMAARNFYHAVFSAGF
jgi:hypothetical protein